MQNETDHDLLIRLDQKVTGLDGKISGIVSLMEKMEDGSRKRLRDLEVRVEMIERDHITVNPVDTYERFVKLERIVHDDLLKRRTVIVLASSVSAVIGFVLAVLTFVLNIGR